MRRRGKNMYQNSIKRMLAVVLSLTGLLLFGWLLLLIMIAIKLDSRGPVFFKQKRVGIHKTYFEIYKFRTMRIDTPHDMPTHLLTNPDQYITRVGRFLRKTSLDELPQLYNILRGDMAVVGPRPALWNQYDLIAERDKYGANDVRPGLTGWAQIHGRDELSVEDKAELDGYYVQHLNLLTDIRCLVGTVRSVLKSEGVVEGGTGAMETAEKIKNSAAKEVSQPEKETSPEKHKVLIITNHSYMLWRFRKELIVALMKTHEVVLSMPFVGHEEDFKELGVRCIDTDVDRRGINPVTDMKLIRTYNRILKQEKPDLVLTYSIKPNIYAGICCAKQKIPFYVNVQGLGTAFQKPGLTQFVTLLYAFALRKVEKVFFENQRNAEEFCCRHIIPKEKQVVLHGAGINLEQYTYHSYPHNDPVHFLYLGRIMKEKGMDELFSAVKRLREDGYEFILDLVGFYEDEYKDQVEQLQKDGIAVFYGFQKNPVPFYSAADCVVLPSYHEGMSNVLLEAAAIGRPVITSNIPGCRETLEHGKTGILAKVKDSESLYRAMKKFLELSSKKRESMGKLGRKKMEREFRKEAVVAETLDALELENYNPTGWKKDRSVEFFT